MSKLLTKHRFELSNSLERMLNDEEVAAVKEDLPHARRLLNVLTARLDKELEEKIQESEASNNYEIPNWGLKQAELLGYRRAIRKVREILRPIEE